MADLTDRPTSLYRCFDAGGQLLYVGITAAGGRRLDQHSKTQPWWGEVANVTVDTYSDRPAALAAEKHAIQTEDPLYNIQHSRAASMAEPQRVQVICTACGTPIDDGDGYLEVSMRAVRTNEDAWEAFKERERARTRPGELVITDIADLMSLPEQVPWVAWHVRCDPDIEATTYAIAVERIASLESVLTWTAHLSGKSWLRATNWMDVIEQLASGAQGVLRLSRVSPR